MSNVSIDILQEDIDYGVRGSPRFCAIASAFNRIYGQVVVKDVGVSVSKCRYFKPVDITAYVRFIASFDKLNETAVPTILEFTEVDSLRPPTS